MVARLTVRKPEKRRVESFVLRKRCEKFEFVDPDRVHGSPRITDWIMAPV